MVPRKVQEIRFDFFSRPPIDVEVQDVQVRPNAGILPIRQFDDPIGYRDRLMACLNDVRRPRAIRARDSGRRVCLRRAGRPNIQTKLRGTHATAKRRGDAIACPYTKTRMNYHPNHPLTL